MLLAAFAFASMLCSDDIPVATSPDPVVQVEEVQEEIIEPEVVIAEPPVELVKPVIHVNMETGPAIKKYEDIISSLPPLYPAPNIAEVFMFDILHKPHVMRMQMHEYEQRQFHAGTLIATMHYTQTASFLQYGTICTAYGDIYVTCTLDDNGNILDPSKPLDVYYASPSLKDIVRAAALNNPHRFPLAGEFSVDTVRNLDDLYFLFGNSAIKEDSYNVAFLL